MPQSLCSVFRDGGNFGGFVASLENGREILMCDHKEVVRLDKVGEDGVIRSRWVCRQCALEFKPIWPEWVIEDA